MHGAALPRRIAVVEQEGDNFHAQVVRRRQERGGLIPPQSANEGEGRGLPQPPDILSIPGHTRGYEGLQRGDDGLGDVEEVSHCR